MNSSLFLHSICNIQINVIYFQHVLTSFAVFQSFIDLFRELNDHETENHYKMNSENVETWHGIIISPTWHVQNTREGYGKNWTHFVYKLDSQFQSIRVSEKTHLLHGHFIFLTYLNSRLFCIPMHHSKRRHKFSTLSNIIC